jgi:hypothetical protein
LTKPIKTGIVAGVIVALCLVLLVSCGEDNSLLSKLITLPALPIIYLLVQAFPPPMGEAEMTPWDYSMAAAGIIVSAFFWGLIAGLVSRFFRFKPKDRA